MSYLCYLCLFVYSGVQHILCCVCFCFVCLRLVSCVPYVVSFSGLYIVDCPFGILYIIDVAQMLLIQNKFSKKIK